MTEERELTLEEQKAKEYVDFYYFWLFNYCTRSCCREIDEKAPRLRGEHSAKEHAQREGLARATYQRHLLSRIHPQIYDFEEVTGGVLVDNLSFVGNATPNNPSTILEMLYDDAPICRGAKKAQSSGLEVLGTDKASLSTDGRLGGYIIAKIDLLAPINDILAELLKLQETKFDFFPASLAAPICGTPPRSIPGYIYLQQSNTIKQAGKASFAVKDDAARAIGLWFWDVIDGSRAIFKDFAEAWRVTCGEQVSDILVAGSTSCDPDPETKSFTDRVERLRGYKLRQDDAFFYVAHRKNCWQEFAVPSRQVFTKLGYSCSDPAVFRRLHRNTKRCIDACEVLSLAD